MADIKFEVNKSLGVLSEGSRGWQKEVNLVSWNERKSKVDIRDWGPDHEKMGKGVTLNKADLIKLKALLNEMDIESMEIE
ncbi:MAG: PC4/YdbC family ssDNA-binding protein [Bacillota bacterium]|nr:PC4/YdbC family ssDNA-binding protein [Bacillota bacterium]